MKMKIELQSVGKLLDFDVFGIKVNMFYAKIKEYGYLALSWKGKRLELNMPGTHEGFLHLSFAWKRRFLWIPLKREVKVAIKII